MLAPSLGVFLLRLAPNSGFGRRWLASLMRVPSPPVSIAAFMCPSYFTRELLQLSEGVSCVNLAPP